MRQLKWSLRAACLDEDPELFFPIGVTGPAVQQIKDAKQVCRRCEVVDACLDWALRTGQDSGVWGGLSELERRTLKRRLGRLRDRRPAEAADVVGAVQVDAVDAVVEEPQRRTAAG